MTVSNVVLLCLIELGKNFLTLLLKFILFCWIISFLQLLFDNPELVSQCGHGLQVVNIVHVGLSKAHIGNLPLSRFWLFLVLQFVKVCGFTFIHIFCHLVLDDVIKVLDQETSQNVI